MHSFPTVRRHDEKRWGERPTRLVILEDYDAMATAIATGETWQTNLHPTPADQRVAHAGQPGGRAA